MLYNIFTINIKLKEHKERFRGKYSYLILYGSYPVVSVTKNTLIESNTKQCFIKFD
jgi:hypothetical protein